MHIKNTKGVVSQVGSLGFMFLKANAKHRYGKLQKKKESHFFLNPPTWQFSHQEMEFYFFTT